MVDNMEWFNVFGLIFIAVIMIPNVVFAIKCKDGFDNKWNNKYVEVTEQVGRLGCFGFMIINIPGTWFGWWSDEAFALYLIVDTILVMLYCAIWMICFKRNSVFKALALSIIPSTAITTAQSPSTPNIIGITYIMINCKIRVRVTDIIAEIFPLLNAVKKADANTLNPMTKKATE